MLSAKSAAAFPVLTVLTVLKTTLTAFDKPNAHLDPRWSMGCYTRTGRDSSFVDYLGADPQTTHPGWYLEP